MAFGNAAENAKEWFDEHMDLCKVIEATFTETDPQSKTSIQKVPKEGGKRCMTTDFRALINLLKKISRFYETVTQPLEIKEDLVSMKTNNGTLNKFRAKFKLYSHLHNITGMTLWSYFSSVIEIVDTD